MLNNNRDYNREDSFCEGDLKDLSVEYSENRFADMIRKHIPPTAGMGVVEVILITVVLISLVIIFQSNIKGIVSSIFSTMQTNVGKIH